ncbi:unnamed protein product [Thlaspi arvense]|uniref:Uncharacterized protein n=1 Tax=Thlaspi arvense TaxID=13288 RepID=A0AAU9R7W7_THLAR|nr:unnamed protein product [Thlaspi arvense]
MTHHQAAAAHIIFFCRSQILRTLPHFMFMKMFNLSSFLSWINQNTQQPPKAKSKRSENVKSKSASETDTNNAPAKVKQFRSSLYMKLDDLFIYDGRWT